MSEPKMLMIDLHQFIGLGLTIGYCSRWDGFVIRFLLPCITFHLETKKRFGICIHNNRV